ncbi:toll/interleukin-1 receptor domain-containing protein [Ideonella sp. YS5]|uniref:toll/interleukin-1 receptor domain-containing protein n=1 Tax=Ideonella sp. YS5 TaxID=3453714 RepID=UPI003EE8F7BB
MPSPQIFLSYRRDDAAGHARAIGGELARRFGADRVFIDVDDIAAGQGFAEVIEQAVVGAAVLLVLIGPRWQGEREGHPSRLFDAGDFVRREVAVALRRGVRVIPLLLDGARMPTADELPPDMQALAGRQALEIDHGRYAADVERLQAELQTLLGSPGAGPHPPGRRAAWAAAGVLGLALAGAGLWHGREPARPAINGQWVAEVAYDWPGANYRESFDFEGGGTDLRGSAAFLGVARGVEQGQVAGHGLSFVTRSAELGGAQTVHRYSGQLVDGEIRFSMLTEGGSTPHVPVAFVARRADAGSAPARR